MTITAKTTSNAKARNAFFLAKIEFDDLLAKLQEASEDHFDAHPDEVNWGDVGSLRRRIELLTQIVEETAL